MTRRSKLKIGLTQQGVDEGARGTTRTRAQIEKYYSGGKRPFTYKKNDRGKVVKVELKGGGMSSGQAKIAAKAPPPNKIDAKDFAVLRAEKAKGRGMGLQDEKVKPGKVMKANLGLMFMKKAKDKGAKGAEFLSPLAMLKRISGKRMGGKIYKAKRGMSFSDKMKAVEDGKINKKTGKPSSMAAMREMKGFKPGESASEFNKRRKALSVAKNVASKTRIGKMLLPVVGAAFAAKTYLNSKMNKKKDVKKKMGGGMMQKPMGYKSGMGPAGAAGPSAGRPGGRRPMQQGPKGGIGSLPKKRNSDDLVVIFSTKDGTKQIKRSDLDNMSAPKKKMGGGMIEKLMGNKKSFANPISPVTMPQDRKNQTTGLMPQDRKIQTTGPILRARDKKMGGGMMMQRPMGYKYGTSVTAKCKLGRNKPTKIT